MTISDNTPSADYKKVYAVANEFLAASRFITSFPFKVKNFLEEQSDIKVSSFSKAGKYGVDISLFGSKSAIIIEQWGAYIVFYNQDEPAYRIRFSILHEFGHYILGHTTDLKEIDPLYGKQELEANCFAAQMLMPEQLLRECRSRGKNLNADFIMQAFGVSREAAQKRVTTLAKTKFDWRSREEKEYDDIILLKYSSTLDQIAPKRVVYDLSWDLERQRERDSWLSMRW
ncbi:MAG: ImmA/IrrE family metallo-endopeptidase [Selenomonadaceae bacterium]|nr:ImmA/IrrE family metallo-endopeptidase [Selenomonadaceae bacterium]